MNEGMIEKLFLNFSKNCLTPQLKMAKTEPYFNENFRKRIKFSGSNEHGSIYRAKKRSQWVQKIWVSHSWAVRGIRGTCTHTSIFNGNVLINGVAYNVNAPNSSHWLA